MTTQSVKLTGLPYLDDELPFDAVRELRLLHRGLEALYNSREPKRYMDIPEATIKGVIDSLRRIITDAEAVYAEHADLCKLMKHLNRAVRHYEVED